MEHKILVLKQIINVCNNNDMGVIYLCFINQINLLMFNNKVFFLNAT